MGAVCERSEVNSVYDPNARSLTDLRRDEKQTMPGPPSSKLTNRKERYNH